MNMKKIEEKIDGFLKWLNIITQCKATYMLNEKTKMYCLRNRWHFGEHYDMCGGWKNND